MQILVISDVHANLTATEAVLKAAAGAWDQLWFLGDLVGYGPDPNECVDLIRDQGTLWLSGNHDRAVLGKLDLGNFNDDARRSAEWTREQLGDTQREFLDTLPSSGGDPPFTLAHASPRHPVWEYILDMQTALENFDHFDTPYCLVGHSHTPSVFRLDDEASELTGYIAAEDEVIDLAPGRLILNPGSVGQPRDGDPRAAYALLDTEANTWQFYRVAYDIAETQRRLRSYDLPDRLAERLELGL